MIFATDRTKTKFQNSKVVFSCFSSASCSCCTWHNWPTTCVDSWCKRRVFEFWSHETWVTISEGYNTVFTFLHDTSNEKGLRQDVTSDLLILVDFSSPPNGSVLLASAKYSNACKMPLPHAADSPGCRQDQATTQDCCIAQKYLPWLWLQ